jgi:hypothetical protein
MSFSIKLELPTTTSTTAASATTATRTTGSSSRKRTRDASFAATAYQTKPPNKIIQDRLVSGQNIDHLRLKNHHEKNPLWVFPYTARNYLDYVARNNTTSSSSSSTSFPSSSSSNSRKKKKTSKSVAGECRVVVETFSPFYKYSVQFLGDIGEPCSRPSHVHEWRLTADSLFSAVALGHTPQKIVEGLAKLSKTELHPDVKEFVLTKCKSAGQLYKVLENGQYYIETTTKHRAALKRLRTHLQTQAEMSGGADIDVLQKHTRVIEECNQWLDEIYEKNDDGVHLCGYDMNCYPWNRSIQRCTKSDPTNKNTSIFGTLTLSNVDGLKTGQTVVYKKGPNDLNIVGLIPDNIYKINKVYKDTKKISLVEGHHTQIGKLSGNSKLKTRKNI